MLEEDSPAERLVIGTGVAVLRERLGQVVLGDRCRVTRPWPWRTAFRRADRMPPLRCTVGRDMNEQDDKLGVHEELQEADLIPDAFPEQDPKVDREWEKAKEDPMGGESPSS